MAGLKLVIEKPSEALLEQFEYVIEEGNNKDVRNLYIKGPYMMAEEVNRNKRKYILEDMVKEVSRYDLEMIKPGRAMGELNHPTSAEVNPERACHVVTELKQDGTRFIGKSKVLSSPLGQLVRSLINDGVQLGMSSRALGQLVEEDTHSIVNDMRLIAIDCVADPSYPKAFVNGILESCEFVCNSDGKYEQMYENFNNSIKNLPRKDVDAYLRERVLAFIAGF